MGKNTKSMILIGSYGSNINKLQMLERVGPFEIVGPAILKNHILVFDKPATRHPGYAVANVRPQKGKDVLCLVQKLSQEAIERLDIFEPGYTRQPRVVEFPDGTTKIVDIYIADITAPGLIPHEEYLEIILDGVEEVFPKYKHKLLKAAQGIS